MRNSWGFGPLLLALTLLHVGCVEESVPTYRADSLEKTATAGTRPVASLLGPVVGVHYLGHAAFILSFDDGVTILMDDGESRTYCHVAPARDFGTLAPNIVVYAHPDMARENWEFPGAEVVSGSDFKRGDVEIRAIPVTEDVLDDNYGYLISYKGFRIFYAGDSQGDMLALDRPEVQKRLKNALPDQVDLLLVPIDWKREITPQAVSYVDFLRPKRVIPMHYWSSEAKERFLNSLETSRRGYYIIETNAPDCRIYVTERANPVEVISLKAGPVVEI